MFSKNRRKVLPSPHPCADDVGVLVYHARNEASQICSDAIDKTFRVLMSWLYTGDNQPKYKWYVVLEFVLPLSYELTLIQSYSCKSVLQGDAVRYRCVTCQYDVIFDQCEICRRDGLDHDNCHEFIAYYCQSSSPTTQQPDNNEGSSIQTRIKQLIQLGIFDLFDNKEGSILNRLETISQISSLILVMILHSDENEFALLSNQLVNLLPTFLTDNNAKKYFSLELAESFCLILQKQASKTTEELGCSLMKVCIDIFDTLSDNENQALHESTKRVLRSTIRLIHLLLMKRPFAVSSFDEDTSLKQSIMRVLTFRQFIRANVELEFHLLCIGSYLDILEESSFLLATSLRRVMSNLIFQSRYQCCGYLLGLFKAKRHLKQLNCEASILEVLKKVPSTQQEFETRLDETVFILQILGILVAGLELDLKLQKQIKDLAQTMRNWLSMSSSLSVESKADHAKKKDSRNLRVRLNDDIPSPVPKSFNHQVKEENEDWFESKLGAAKPDEHMSKKEENRVTASSLNATRNDENDIPWSIMLKNRAKNVAQRKSKSKSNDISTQSVTMGRLQQQQQQLNFKAKAESDPFVMFPFLETVSIERLKETSFSQIHEQPHQAPETRMLNLIEEILRR